MTAEQRKWGLVLLVGLAAFFVWDLLAFSSTDALLDVGAVVIVFALFYGWSIWRGRPHDPV